MNVIKAIVTRRKTLLYKRPLLLEENKYYVDRNFNVRLWLVISAIVNINIYPLFYSKLLSKNKKRNEIDQ